MNKRIRFVLVILCFATGIAFSREETPIPKEPFVVPQSAGIQWQTNIRRGQTDQDQSARRNDSVSIHSRIGKNSVQHHEVLFSNGTRSEFYVINGWILEPFQNSEKISIYPRESLGDFSVRSPGWLGMFWIGPGNYRGVDAVEETECFYYHMTGLKGSELPDDFEFSAWVRVSDSKPVRARLGDTTYEYSEVSSYQGEIVLPPNYLEAWGRYQKRLQVLAALRNEN